MENNFVSRLWAKDATLFTKNLNEIPSIQERLGWLTCVDWSLERADEIGAFAQKIRGDGFQHAVLLGMGGSSLCPEVFRRLFGHHVKGLKLHVLDSTDPDHIRALEKQLDFAKTFFIVSSKSGTTVEVTSFFKHFSTRVPNLRQFAAITDPGTVLEKQGKELGFRHVFINDPEIGGRYSALSYFGLVPAALMGMDIKKVLRSAKRMIEACQEHAEERNPGVALGKNLSDAWRMGKDKALLMMPENLQALGLWIEQLVGESTGKGGKGIVPAVSKATQGPDRVGVEIRLLDLYDIGGEFVRWEVATSYASCVMEVNPFDEPNVQEAKDLTKSVLEAFKKEGRVPRPTPVVSGDGWECFADAGLKASGKDAKSVLHDHLARVAKSDYVAWLSYVPIDTATEKQMQHLQELVEQKTGAVSTVGFGPRYLHSTGQLHKGGKANGLFIQLTHSPVEDLPIPGEPFTFGTLVEAQAAGDFQALSNRGRRILRLHWKGSVSEKLALIESWLR